MIYEDKEQNLKTGKKVMKHSLRECTETPQWQNEAGV